MHPLCTPPSIRLPSARRNHAICSKIEAFSFNATNGRKQKNRRKVLITRLSGSYRVQDKNASIVSILTFLYGGGGGNRTPVRKSIHTAFSGRRRPINFPLSAGERRPAGEVASLVHDRPQSLRRYTFTAVSRRVPDRSPSGHDGYRLSGNCKFIVICVYF